MLFLRIDEQVVEGGDAFSKGLLRTDSCRRAPETRGAFAASGTLVEPISGVPHLIRQSSGTATGAAWGRAGDSRERREREEPAAALEATSLVFLPAIPSWLPLWSLLSPEDATSGGGGGGGGGSKADGSRSSSTAPSAATAPEAGAETSSLEGTAAARAGASGGGGGDGCCSSDGRASGRFAAAGGNGNGNAGRGAVRLVQTVAAVQTPYRYAAVLHFWDVADAAVFAERINGLTLPSHAMVKALFLSGAEVIPVDAGSPGGGDREASFRQRRRRSLSEGVAAGANSAALHGTGSEEFKSSWSGRNAQGGGARLSCSPPRDHDRFAGAPKSRRGRGAAGADGGPARAAAAARGSRRSESASPSPPVRVTTTAVEERKGRSGSGGGDGEMWRDGGDGEEGEGMRNDSLSPTPPWDEAGGEILLPLGGGGGRPARRQRGGLAWGDGAGARSGRGRRLKLGSPATAVGGMPTELPPCPVCFDRLDPTVIRVPFARTCTEEYSVAGQTLRDGERCNHRRCGSAAAAGASASGEAVAAATPTPAGAAPNSESKGGVDIGVEGTGPAGCEAQMDSDRGGNAEEKAGGPLSNGKGAVKQDGAGGRGPRWEGERGGVGGGESANCGRTQGNDSGRGNGGGCGGGGGGTPALNVVMWKGSNCRVCRSLNVALEGAQDELFCETCKIAHNLWICMVCGHIGCGRYTGEHANRHFRLSGHTYSLELSTGRVWDYTGDCYAHRALRGHVVSSNNGGGNRGSGYGYGYGGSGVNPERDVLAGARGGEGDGAGRDGSPPLYSEGAFGEQGDASSLKVAVVSREYEALVARQLQEQQRYFEDLIATAVAADAEANSPLEEVLTEEERDEVAKLREAVDELTAKHQGILDSLRADEETARRVRLENRALVSEQRHHKQEEGRLIDETRRTKRQCEQQMAELEGQMQDLMFFLRAQEEVKASPRREELVGGSVVMGGSSAGSAGGGAGTGRGAGRETERERLARRLKEREPATEEIPPLAFEVTNFYHVRDGKPGADIPWLQDIKLVEPHRDTTFSVSSPREGFDYIWEVHGGDPDLADVRATARGAEVMMVLTILDGNMVTLKEVEPGGVAVRQLDEMVMVKYVRREVRTLTDDEREELLDAMFQLWAVRVDGGDGKELYGDDYADIYAINRLHFKAASNKTCDHFHDGLGFLTSHSLITNTFEYSLQRVNPKLTLPYWDFTIEELEAEDGLSAEDDELILNPPLFQESWFGTADPVDYKVKDGRWANTKIPSMYDGNPGDLTPDVYGLLRSRWNVNSSPYLTRGLGKLCDGYVTDSYHWPTCELHHWLVTGYTDFYSWVWESMYAPHGPVHTWIGGVLNCEDTVGAVSALVGAENADALALYAFDQRKNFWRDEMFECIGHTADVGEPSDALFSSGQCGCLEFDLTQGDDWQVIYYNSTVDFDDVIGDYDDETKRAVVAAVCASTIFDGDHLQAGSSLDPTFWLMHPTMERLFMFSVLTGRTTDLTWHDTDVTYTDSAGNTVYDMNSRYGDTCHGHGGSDVFPFGLLDTDIDGFEVKTGIRGNLDTGNMLTNREVLEAMDASVNMLPYVYDTFKWNHCLSAGIDFDDAWVTSSADDGKKETSARKPASKENHLFYP
eukprot:g7402.t1